MVDPAHTHTVTHYCIKVHCKIVVPDCKNLRFALVLYSHLAVVSTARPPPSSLWPTFPRQADQQPIP
eukprot:3270881-Amphidinium_carterae.1